MSRLSKVLKKIPVVNKIAVPISKALKKPAVAAVVAGVAAPFTGGASLAAVGAAAGGAYGWAKTGGDDLKKSLTYAAGGAALGYGVSAYGAATTAKYAAGGALLTGKVSPEAAVLAEGSLPGYSETLPSGAADNPSLWDSAVNYFGKKASGIFNPGAAETGSSGYVASPGDSETKKPINWKWLIGIGGGLLLLWLILKR